MRHRLAIILPIYVALFAISLAGSYLLRFEFSVSATLWRNMLAALPVLLGIKLLTFAAFREWDRTFRYATINDAFVTTGCCLFAAVGIIIARVALDDVIPVPRSIILIDALLSVLFVAGFRVTCRLLWNGHLQAERVPDEPALIYGNDLTAIGIWKMLMARNGHLGRYRVVGFIDPGPECQRSLIGGLPVYSEEEGFERAACRGIKHILVPTTVSGRVIRDLLHEAHEAGISVHKIPTVEEIVEGRFRLAVRELDIDDLLRRPATRLDLNEIRDLIEDKTVLVTGGAGSIGSELCRQIVGFEPKRLIVFDHSEFGVFEIEREFARQGIDDVELIYITASVLDSDALEQVFSDYQPQLVFHAAAYKHVPLMQDNPYAAIRNNVLGTKAVVDAAHRHGAERFVLISTDKAVRPTSVMGATKLMAEKYLQAMAKQSQTEFITVRFGNVLNSVGSVVPTFRKQIEQGGPVTVTHRDMVRYFMTIPEAVQLVLQAGASGQSGHVLILDMGDPVKIVDLAKDMITLSGLSYPDDIEIKFTGLRPGEKMYEELFYQHEKGAVKIHEKIFLGSGYAPTIQEINTDLSRLKAALSGSRELSGDTLWNVVDRYVSIDDADSAVTMPRAA